MADYIEREKVFDIIAEVFEFAEDAEEAIFELNSCVKALPSADVRPVTPGGWIGVDDEPFEAWECGRCGKVVEDEYRLLPNFCPNCGADMRGEPG